MITSQSRINKVLVLTSLVITAACSQPVKKSDLQATGDSVVRDGGKSTEQDRDSVHRELAPGDTVRQNLAFAVGGDEVKFYIEFVMKKYRSGAEGWRMILLAFKKTGSTLPFSDQMIERLQEDFESFYSIPVVNYQPKIKPVLTLQDVEHFLIVKDYNLDGVDDVGISQSPSGNNVFEHIYIRLNDRFVYWKKLSGNPVYFFHPGERKITTVWHMSAEAHSIREYKITGDTTLHEVSGDDTIVLDDEKLIKKTYQDGKLVTVDTIPRL